MPNAAMFVCDQVATYFGAKRTPGEGVLPTVGYRLHPKGVPFLSSQYMKE